MLIVKEKSNKKEKGNNSSNSLRILQNKSKGPLRETRLRQERTIL